MSSFRCGCERGEVVSGGRLGGGGNSGLVGGFTRAPRPCASGWCALSARPNGWCGCTLARSRQGGRESCPAGGASMAVSAGPAVPPRSVFSFRVRCGFRRSLVLGLVVVGRLRSVSQTAVPRGTEQAGAGCRPVGLCRNGAAFARSRPFSRGSRRPLAGSRPAASTGRPQGHPVRRSVLSDAVWRTRVGARPRQRRRRRLTCPGPPVWRPSAGGTRLGASPDVPLLGAGGRSTSGGPVCSAPASLLSVLVRVRGQCPRARRCAWVQRVGRRLAGGRFRSWSHRFGGLVLPGDLRIAQMPAALDAVTGAFTSGSVGLTRVTGFGPGPHAQGSSCSTAKGRPVSSTKLVTPMLLVQNHGRLGWPH